VPPEGTNSCFGLASAFGSVDGLGIALHFLIVAFPHVLQNVPHLVHPAALMEHPRVDRRDRCCKSGTAIGDDQQQVFAPQPAPIQIPEQSFPGTLTLPVTAEKGQQLPRAVAPHPVSHQHLHPLPTARPTHPQTHAIQKQVRPFIGQPKTHPTLRTPRCRTFRNSAIVFSQPKHSSTRLLFL
jgi:hypothetical protein